jgi:glycosyltransferase involved in cell wall biosynthesis
MTTRNNAASLRYALESIIAQTFVNFEVWVIGGNCSDHSEDIVNSFCDPRFFWFNCPSAESDFHLISEGLNRSRGEYVAYLRDGDLWLPNHLESVVEWMTIAEADIVFSISQSIKVDSTSFLNIPQLPELPVIPNPSSVLHKKNCVFVPLPEDRRPREYNAELFQRAKEENLAMEVVPITTGLSFLGGDMGCHPLPQSIYMERLRKEPDFINKELSAILFRSQNTTVLPAEQNFWTRRLAGPLNKMLNFLLNRGGTMRELKNLNHQDVSLVTKSAKAIFH